MSILYDDNIQSALLLAFLITNWNIRLNYIYKSGLIRSVDFEWGSIKTTTSQQ